MPKTRGDVVKKPFSDVTNTGLINTVRGRLKKTVGKKAGDDNDSKELNAKQISKSTNQLVKGNVTMRGRQKKLPENDDVKSNDTSPLNILASPKNKPNSVLIPVIERMDYMDKKNLEGKIITVTRSGRVASRLSIGKGTKSSNKSNKSNDNESSIEKENESTETESNPNRRSSSRKKITELESGAAKNSKEKQQTKIKKIIKSISPKKNNKVFSPKVVIKKQIGKEKIEDSPKLRRKDKNESRVDDSNVTRRLNRQNSAIELQRGNQTNKVNAKRAQSASRAVDSKQTKVQQKVETKNTRSSARFRYKNEASKSPQKQEKEKKTHEKGNKTPENVKEELKKHTRNSIKSDEKNNATDNKVSKSDESKTASKTPVWKNRGGFTSSTPLTVAKEGSSSIAERRPDVSKIASRGKKTITHFQNRLGKPMGKNTSALISKTNSKITSKTADTLAQHSQNITTRKNNSSTAKQIPPSVCFHYSDEEQDANSQEKTTKADVQVKTNTIEKPNLRKVTEKNYAELSQNSLNDSQNESKKKQEIQNPANKSHVPIYKQTLQEDNRNKNMKEKEDLYKIDFEYSDELKPKKGAKNKGSDNDDSINEYDKKMDMIMQKLRDKLEKSKGIEFKKIQKKVPPKPAEQKKPVEQKKPDLYQLYISSLHTTKKKPMKKTTFKPRVKRTRKVSEAKSSKSAAQTPQPNHFDYDDDDDCGNDVDQIYANVPLQSNSDSKVTKVDNLKANNEVNILSNVLIQPAKETEESILDISFSQPDANSTVIGPQQDKQSTPWRLNLMLRKNPHILQYKKSNLPNYDQEMVIDSNFLENSLNYKINTPVHEPDMSKTPHPNDESKATPQKLNTIQSSILDFVTGSSIQPTKQPQNVSLFDAEQFSPIKKKSPQKQIPSPKKTKRKLCEDEDIENVPPNSHISITSNTILSPQNTSHENEEANDLDNYFGFDSTLNESVTYGKANKKGEVKNVQDKPTRVELKEVRKVIAENKVAQVETDVVNDPTVIVEEDEGNNTNNEVPVVGLFEDFEPAFKKNTKRIYERVRIGRRRLLSEHTEDEEDDEAPKAKKRKKDTRTKEEEKQAEAWYSKFNAICNEIDQHELTIE